MVWAISCKGREDVKGMRYLWEARRGWEQGRQKRSRQVQRRRGKEDYWRYETDLQAQCSEDARAGRRQCQAHESLHELPQIGQGDQTHQAADSEVVRRKSREGLFFRGFSAVCSNLRGVFHKEMRPPSMIVWNRPVAGRRHLNRRSPGECDFSTFCFQRRNSHPHSKLRSCLLTGPASLQHICLKGKGLVFQQQSMRKSRVIHKLST